MAPGSDEKPAAGEWYAAAECRVEDLDALVSRQSDVGMYSYAARVVDNIVCYDADDVRGLLADPLHEKALLGEWADVLLNRNGVLMLAGAYDDTRPIDAASRVFEQIIGDERDGANGADHFAAAGANDRVWNAQEKLCLRAPEIFAQYFANDLIAAVCRAWLGPNYQLTSQVNLVRPGGGAQSAHRDYHLGFQTDDEAAKYPAHIHQLSPLLTLQGAVAHCDMPVESGPTQVLPYSQLYRPGYLAWRRADFRAYFDAHRVQLALKKGDALFFNPALFHAAGANRTTNIARMANLLQVSSAFGRAMETVDRRAMSNALFPVICAQLAAGDLSPVGATCAIAACAEGYSFPTNLDRDPPTDGLAPQSAQALFHQGVDENWPETDFADRLDALYARRGG